MVFISYLSIYLSSLFVAISTGEVYADLLQELHDEQDHHPQGAGQQHHRQFEGPDPV